MNIDWSKAPEGATHATPSGTFIREERGDRFVAYWEWLYEWVLIESGLEKDQLIERPKKTLTQAVFDGLPPEYRWGAYDITGDCYAYKIKPKQDYGVSQWDVVDRANNAKMMGEWHLDVDEETGYWLHSLIERQDVSNRVEQLRSVEEARQVEATLAERQNQYGDFSKVAGVSQHLQSVIWAAGADFDDVQQEAIQMICSKLARLACGDADHVDSWHDIAGYATLVVKDLESGK